MISNPGCVSCGKKRGIYEAVPLCAACVPALVRLFVPAAGRCPVCLARLTKAGRCSACAKQGTRLIERTFAPFLYYGEVRRLVVALKFGDDLRAAPILSSAMNRALFERDFDMVTPVPLSKSRERERGFNQAALLALPIADAISAPLVMALERVKNTKRQSALRGAKARQKNVEGAFRVKEGIALSGRRVLLVDDVRTTGATALACAEALKSAGAKSVKLLVAAVAPNAGRGQQKRTWREKLT